MRLINLLRHVLPVAAFLCVSSLVSAADATTGAFASVWKIKGEVTVTAKGETSSRLLKEGDQIRVGDRVRAAPNAEAVLKTTDAGMVGVRPGAEFVAESYAAEGKSTDGMVTRLLTGSLRIISGWIGKTNRNGHLVETPTATIGIRGTDHEPFVMLPEMAKKTSYKEGTYDKVNRGKTVVETGPHSLEVEAGKVGFAQSPNFPPRTRALMAILMPVLLDKIPDFYVPGEFDADLDKYSAIADTVSQRELEKVGGGGTASPAAPGTAAPARPDQAAPSRKEDKPRHALDVPGCDALTIGKAWVEALDGAIVKRDAASIIATFAPEVAIEVNVRTKGAEMSRIELNRDQMAISTVTAIAAMEDYQHRRVSIDAVASTQRPAACNSIEVKSVVIEQGRQAGKPFRFESLEEYVLEQREGKWLAMKAKTTQR